MRLFLVDGMSVLFRGYYALLNAGLRSQDGEPTGATFAFVSTLEKLLESEKPDLIAVAWDTAAPTFRHEQYEEYKAHRPEFPEELVPQLERVKELISYYRIPSIEMEGYEADDVIGTLAVKAAEAGHDVFCVTPDKDYLQLVNDRIRICKPSKPGQPLDLIDTEGVREKFGVDPGQVIDVLALMGDSSDNVPGVKGVGEKTAIPLIQEFGSVENLYEKIDDVGKKGVRNNLEKDHDNAILSKTLVTIDTDVPVEFDPDDLKYESPDTPNLLRLFDRLGFSSLIARYQDRDGVSRGGDSTRDGKNDVAKNAGSQGLKTIKNTEHEYELVDTEKRLDGVVKEFGAQKVIVFDLETDSTNEMNAAILGIAISARKGTGVYIPIAAAPQEELSHDESLFGEEGREAFPTEGLPEKAVIEKVKPLLENGDVAKVAQNGKYDIIILKKYGIEVSPFSFDTMLAAFVLDSTLGIGMDALAERFLNYRPVSITELIGPKGKNQKSMREIDVETVSEYAAEDADITLQLYERLKDELESNELLEVAERFEFPLVPVLAQMEYTGVKVDRKALEEISAKLADEIDGLEKEIYDLAGHAFTINSPKQLSTVLFEELELPPQKKTKTGYSTDQSVLEELSTMHDLPQRILEYRQAAKLKSTYVDALPKLINPRTGRIHTSYNQAIAATGRLSSNNPNLQNIPIRTERGQEIRKAFVPGIDDAVLVAADYSQIELRIMAHISGDENLLKAFREGHDIHASTAMRVFGVEEDEVDGDMRRKAKVVNFGIMYGIGPYGLARRLNIGRDEAKELIDTYFERFPKVSEYINGILQQLREVGYVETLGGRRRHYGNPDNYRNPQRGMIERAAINMPIQGTAADIIKRAMIDLHEELPSAFPDVNMLLQVHDELVFEAPKGQAEELAAFAADKMQNAFPLEDVVLEVETGKGANWFEAH